MRINFYLILISVVFLCFSSCSKGSIVQEPQFGTVSLKNITDESVKVVQDEKTATLAPGADLNISIVSGHRRFKFYSADTIQKDTSLAIDPFVMKSYVLFRPNAMVDLQIFDTSLNGFAKIPSPDSGQVKLSLANFSSSSPSKVNVYLTTKTYINNVQKDIQVGEFLQVTTAFSDFKTVILGAGLASKPQTLYTITIKDPVDNHIIANSAVNFPSVGATGALLSTVYLLYIDSNNNVNILMSK